LKSKKKLEVDAPLMEELNAKDGYQEIKKRPMI